MVRRFFVLALCAFGFLNAADCEQILLFDADIVVHKDATLTVTEEITVRSCEQTIRRGIVREFPTIYTDSQGNKYKIDFVLHKVLLNEQSVAYHVEDKNNGVYIYIGDPAIVLSKGIYTFALVYTVNRQLGFFDTHDELYWNVTGNGWRLPIAQVQARVTLPEGVDIAAIKTAGYTGLFGARDTAVVADVMRNGVARFKSTRPFARFEGLSIVIGWPKGIVEPPTLQQKIIWFLRDNMHYAIFLLSLLFLFGFLLYIYRKNKNREGNYATIPLFTAPEGMTPGTVNYFNKMDYADTALTADIVNMAVHGWLTIKRIDQSLVQNFFGTQKFALEKKSDNGLDRFPFYRKLYDLFFAQGDQFALDTANAHILQNAKSVSQLEYDTDVGVFLNSTLATLLLLLLQQRPCGFALRC